MLKDQYFVTQAEAAGMLNLSTSTIRKLIKRKVLKAVPYDDMGARCVRIPVAEIERYTQANQSQIDALLEQIRQTQEALQEANKALATANKNIETILKAAQPPA